MANVVNPAIADLLDGALQWKAVVNMSNFKRPKGKGKGKGKKKKKKKNLHSDNYAITHQLGKQNKRYNN